VKGTVTIPSFENGEVSKRALGNLNIERYSASLKLLENFIVTPTGSITRRPGTEYFVTPPAGVPLRIISAWNYVVLGMGASPSLALSGVVTTAAMDSANIAYIDDINRQLIMYRWTGSGWIKIGSGLQIVSSAVSFGLCSLNNTDVALIDDVNNTLRTYRFNGSTWVQIGNSFSIPGTITQRMSALNATDIAFLDHNLKSLRCYRFDGTNWTLVGAGLSLPGIGTGPTLCALSATDVAVIDGTLELLQVYRFNGSFWAALGSSFSVPGIFFPAITRLTSTDIALVDITLKLLKVFRFDGAAWSQVGVSFSLSGIYNASNISAINGTDIAAIVDTPAQIQTYRFDGTNWQIVGNGLSIDFSSTEVSSLNFYDPYSSKLLQTVDISAFNIGDEFDYEIIKNVMYMVSESGICSITRTPGTTDTFAADELGIESRIWTQKGNALSLTAVTSPVLCKLNATDFVFVDTTIQALRVYRFDGLNFSLVGTSLATGANQCALCQLNATDVALFVGVSAELRTYRWDGDSWAQVGSGFSIVGTGIRALARMNDTDVAFIDATLESLRCYRFNGSTWSLVGSGLTVAGIDKPSLASINETDVAFIDETLESLRMYRFDGSNWSLLGSALSIPGITAPSITGLNPTDIAFLDTTMDVLKIYRFENSIWSAIGTEFGISSATNVAICSLSPNLIVEIDESLDKLRAFSLSGNYKADGSDGNSPKYISSFEGRLCFAATENNPTSIFLSKAPTTDLQDDYLTDLTVGPLAGDSIELTLRSSDIQWIQGKDFLYIGTDTDEWIIQGGQSGIIPGEALAKIVSSEGSRGGVSSVTSLGVCFSKFGNGHIMKNIFSQAIQGYTPGDLVNKAGHINFKYIKRIETQNNPWEIIWILDEAYGRLYALSNTGKQYALSRITSELNGVDIQVIDIISRATKPVSQSDEQSYELYMLTKRTMVSGSIGYFVERIKGFDLFKEDIFESTPPEDTELIRSFQAKPILDLQSKKQSTRALGVQTLDLSYINGETVQLYAVSKETVDDVTEYAFHGDLPGEKTASSSTAIENSYYLDDWIVYAGIPVTSRAITAGIDFQTDSGPTFGKLKQIGRVITKLVDALSVKIRDYGADDFTEILPETNPPLNQVGPLMTGDAIKESVGTQFRKDISIEIEVSKAYPAEITCLVVDVETSE
jgi:hypothetical protein